jgi:hypothetical protein
MALRWRVYYDDGSTFDDTMGSPADSVGWGVVATVSTHPAEGKTFQSMADYYVFDPRAGWVGTDLCGLFDRLGNRVPMEAVCFGRMIPNEDYARIHRQALEDPDFHRKSQRAVGEPVGHKKRWNRV